MFCILEFVAKVPHAVPEPESAKHYEEPYMSPGSKELEEFASKFKKSCSQADMLNLISTKHTSRKDHLVKRNTLQSKLKIEEPKRFTFENEERQHRGSFENGIETSLQKGPSIAKYVQSVFSYNHSKKKDSILDILKDDSNRHLNAPPSPRFGEMSLSFGNNLETRSTGDPENFNSDEAEEICEGFSNLLRNSNQRGKNASIII